MRESYYDMLEKSQKSGSLDITTWVQWYVRAIFGAVSHALAAFERTVEKSLFWAKAKTLPLGARQIRALSALNHGFLGTLDSQVYAKMNSCSLSVAEAEFAQLMDLNLIDWKYLSQSRLVAEQRPRPDPCQPDDLSAQSTVAEDPVGLPGGNRAKPSGSKPGGPRM
jgi:hypothetical protein